MPPSDETPPAPIAEAPIRVEVGDPRSFLTPSERSELEALAAGVLEAEGIARAEVSIALVDDASIHAVNRRHLDHDEPTDVISFVLSDEGDELAGELVISVETARRVASAEGGDPATELALYAVHGLLHLCGYDDRTGPEAAAMRLREGFHLGRSGLSHPFSPPPADPGPTLTGALPPASERSPWPR